MKSNPAEYKEIISKLLEKTRQRRVQWEGGLGSYSCSVGTTTDNTVKFTLSARSTQYTDLDVRFLVMEDHDENELFRVESNDLPTSTVEADISVMIEELYDLARHQALKVDEKIERASILLDSV